LQHTSSLKLARDPLFPFVSRILFVRFNNRRYTLFSAHVARGESADPEP
jgi:hypothetical protein